VYYLHPSESILKKQAWVWIIPILLSIVIPVYSFFSFAPDLLIDDAAIALKYIDNITAGNGYRYNASDYRPVFGSSSLVFTYLTSLLKATTLFDWNFMYIRLPGLVGYGIVLFLSFLIGHRIGGFLLGLLTLSYVASFPHYFCYADSGLETLMVAALLAGTFYSFYFRKADRFVFLLCAGLACSKIDMLAVSIIVAGAQVYDSSRYSSHPWRDCVAIPVGFFVAPVAIVFAFCWFYFGSPIPSSLAAKVTLDWSPEGLRYFWRFFSITQPTSFILLVSLTPIAMLLAKCSRQHVMPSFRFCIVALAAAILLVQLWCAPFTNMFLWYFVVPFLAFQFTVIFSINEYVASSEERDSYVSCLVFLPVVAFTLVGMFTPLFGGLQKFSNITEMHQTFLTTVERERRAIGHFLKQVGQPQDVLLTGYGWPAYDSGMNVVDITGINTPTVLEFAGQDLLYKALEKYSPAYIADYKLRHRLIAEQYDLIKLGFAVRQYTKGWYNEWEIYRKKRHPLEYLRVVYLNPDECLQSFTEEGWGRKIVKQSASDLLMYPSSRGVADTRIEFENLSLDDCTVGAYCYVANSESAPVEFILEVIFSTGDVVSKRIKVTHGDGIVPVAADIAGAHEKVRMRISTRIDGPVATRNEQAHVRDIYIAALPKRPVSPGIEQPSAENRR
jgi:hypothetical protein